MHLSERGQETGRRGDGSRPKISKQNVEEPWPSHSVSVFFTLSPYMSAIANKTLRTFTQRMKFSKRGSCGHLYWQERSRKSPRLWRLHLLHQAPWELYPQEKGRACGKGRNTSPSFSPKSIFAQPLQMPSINLRHEESALGNVKASDLTQA